MHKINNKNIFKYKHKKEIEISNNFIESNISNPTDNTLIERDLKDPSPTINATFRIIGNTNRRNQSSQNFDEFEPVTSNDFNLSDEQYTNNDFTYKNDDSIKTLENDWNNDDFTNW